MVHGTRAHTAAPRRLRRQGAWWLLVIFILASVASTINYQAVMADIGRGPSIGSLPNTPSVDEATMDKAANTAPGQKLKTQGYSPQSVISDTGLSQWFDGEQQSVAKLSNSGPYVIFSTGVAQAAAKPDPGTPPAVVVDVTNQVIVGLYQTYTDDRGAACYTSGDPRQLSTVWVPINLALWNKNLSTHAIMLSSTDVPQLPAGMGTVACYIFQP